MDVDRQGTGMDTPAVRRYFTVDEANAALVLVRRIVQDVVQDFESLMDCQEMAEAAVGRDIDSHREAKLAVRRLFGRLQQYRDELAGIGVDLRDWARGVVHFPARVGDREVVLCWRHGEDRVGCWHELTAGLTGCGSARKGRAFDVWEEGSYWSALATGPGDAARTKDASELP